MRIKFLQLSRSKRRMAWRGALLLLAGCQTSTEFERGVEDIEFSTLLSQYALGDTIQARLVNGSRFAILYNLCFTGIEAYADGRWTSVGPFGLGVCAGVSNSLEVGESARSSAVVQELKLGQHRLVTRVEVGGSATQHLTAEFLVR